MINNYNEFQNSPYFSKQWETFAHDQHLWIYRHKFVQCFCQIRSVRNIGMKDVDTFSSRESFTYQFCPKIYKTVIGSNYYQDGQILQNLTLQLEYVENRLEKNITKEIIPDASFLSSKLSDIIKGFRYLFKRYGAFEIRQKMIGWTNDQVTKVWIDQDYGSNKIRVAVESEYEMVESLIKLLKQYQIHNFIFDDQIQKTFDNLLVKAHQKTETPDKVRIKQVAFKQNRNIQSSVNIKSFQWLSKVKKPQYPPLQKRSSVKNITFSYSNKNLESPSQIGVYSKRNSIEIISPKFQCIPDQKKISTGVSNRLFDQENLSQKDISLKIIKIGKKGQKRKSRFGEEIMHSIKTIQNSSKNKQNCKSFTTQSFKIDKKTNFNNSNTSQSFGNKTQNGKCFFPYKPKLLKNLHFSTSTNPYKKPSTEETDNNEVKSIFSSKNTKKQQHQKDYINQQSTLVTKENHIKITDNEGTNIKQWKINEKEVKEVRQSQQIQNDLDALFPSQKSIDYEALENQLDGVLFQ